MVFLDTKITEGWMGWEEYQLRFYKELGSSLGFSVTSSEHVRSLYLPGFSFLSCGSQEMGL